MFDVSLRVREIAEKTITYDFRVILQADGKLAAEGYVKCIAVNSKWKAVALPREVARTVSENMG